MRLQSYANHPRMPIIGEDGLFCKIFWKNGSPKVSLPTLMTLATAPSSPSKPARGARNQRQRQPYQTGDSWGKARLYEWQFGCTAWLKSLTWIFLVENVTSLGMMLMPWIEQDWNHLGFWILDFGSWILDLFCLKCDVSWYDADALDWTRLKPSWILILKFGSWILDLEICTFSEIWRLLVWRWCLALNKTETIFFRKI